MLIKIFNITIYYNLEMLTKKVYLLAIILAFFSSVNGFQCTNNCLVCADPNTCSQCEVQYFLVHITNCVKCPIGCLQCISTAQCQNCLPGYTLISNLCQPCVDYCIECSDASSCNTCINGFYLQKNVCEACPNFCLSCNSTQSCSQCVIGYGFNSSSNNCQYCNLNSCLTCQMNGNETFCLNCVENTFVNGSICSSCPSGCLKCRNKSGKCIQCLQFYYPDQDSGECVRCQPNSCQACLNASYCTECAVGYLNQISNDTIICSPCQNNCLQCTNQTNCQLCSLGYYVSQQSTCLQCSSKCLQCESGNQCSQCMLGYYLGPQNLCIGCPNQCAICASATQCSQCLSPSYYFNGSFCLFCQQAISNCIACYGNKCIQCQIGYDVVGYKCQDNSTSISAFWIVLMITSLLAILGGIGFGVYMWWRRRQGFMGPLGGQEGSGLRASYYQVP